jgi:helix-turn-helix protein
MELCDKAIKCIIYFITDTKHLTTLVCDDMLTEERFELDVSGNSKTHLNLETSETVTKASGASEINIQGTTESLIIQNISGGSIFQGFDFSASYVSVSSSGGSRVFVTADKQLTVNASGGSEIQYKGSPTIELSGGSLVIKSN